MLPFPDIITTSPGSSAPSPLFCTLLTILATLFLFPLPSFAAFSESHSEIFMGSVSMDTPGTMRRNLTPLAEYLSAKSGIAISIKPSPRFTDAARDLATGSVSISYLTPVAYINSQRQNKNVIPIAAALSNGKAFLSIVIAVPIDSPAKTPSDLKGKSFAFGDPLALLQKASISQAGLSEMDFSRIAYLNHFNNISRAILAGEFDAGILKDSAFEEYKSKGLREIYRSKPFPGYVIAANSSIGQANIEKIRSALLNIDSITAKKLLHSLDPSYTGFAPVSDSSFDAAREAISPFDSHKNR